MSNRWMVALLSCASALAAWGAEPLKVQPGKLPKLATVDERFQAYNIEMVEVVGGRFWAPYKKAAEAEKAPQSNLSVPGIDPSLFRQRQPIDLGNARLRKLASALAPSYVRVSGSWANSTYFHDSDTPAPATPPEGFGGVLTRAQWKGVIEFSKAVNAGIVTSFAISPGVRDQKGVWTPSEAKKILDFTKASGGTIAAAELFNEPTVATMAGAPKGYDGAAYGRDFKAFLPFVRQAAPQMIVLGPGSIGEVGMMGGLPMLKSADMLAASGPGLDGFSYHFYGSLSKRCAMMGGTSQTTQAAALSEDWLARTDRDAAFYSELRDRFEPGKPMWLTETGETACGGNPWASTYVDTFRYLEQMGRLARRGFKSVMHNTLAASDYGMIDEETLTPRPNYWAAYLWRRFMGTTVLDAGKPEGPVHVFAQCLRGQRGGVALMALNIDEKSSHSLDLPVAAERFSMTSKELLGGTVELNGKPMELGPGDSLPALNGLPVKAGSVELAPASITFLTVGKANNAACR